METQLQEFIVQLETKQNLHTLLLELQRWLVGLGGAAPEKSIRKAHEEGQLEAFCELQNSFAYNLCGRLVQLLSGPCAEEVLYTIQGVCLLHRPSRCVFQSDVHLRALLQQCQSGEPPVQLAAINTLSAVMVRQTPVIRRFEALGGLKTITDIFKARGTPFTVKRAILEFLFFYLIPETKYKDPSKRSTGDKQVMLGKYLSNVDGLVRELEVNKPFGSMDVEW